jgi:hypothetical protein
MKRVSLDRVRNARESLAAVPLPRAGGALLGFFALKRRGVTINEWTVVSPTDFADLAAEFYEVEGAPDQGKPYFDPLSPKGGWRNDNWARGSTNTAFYREATPLRRDKKLEQRGQGENREWRFIAGYEQSLPKYIADRRIPALDYAAWAYRTKAFGDDATPEDLVLGLRAELNLTEKEFAALFDPARAEDPGTFFTTEDWPAEAVLDLLPPQDAGEDGGHAGAGDDGADEGEDVERPEPPPDDELIPNLLKCLRVDEHFDVADDLVRDLLFSLRSDRIAILAGKPGTGKTEFARAFVRCLGRALSAQQVETRLIEVAVSEELAEFDLIGYRDLGGAYVPSRVMEDFNRGNPDADLYVLLLDEMNLAAVDVYGAKLIAGITNRIPVDLPGTSDLSWFPKTGKWTPHNGILVVGTMNSYLEDPNRKMLSVPIKRRANLIIMPDPLRELATSDADQDEAPDRFRELCGLLLQQLSGRLRRRGLSVLESRFLEQLVYEVPEEAVQVLWRLTRRLAVHDEVAMTMGLVQSILRFVQTSTFESVSTALDLQVEQKVLPVVRGAVTVLDEVDEALGTGEWRRARAAIGRMRRLAEDNAGRIKPLL